MQSDLIYLYLFKPLRGLVYRLYKWQMTPLDWAMLAHVLSNLSIIWNLFGLFLPFNWMWIVITMCFVYYTFVPVDFARLWTTFIVNILLHQLRYLNSTALQCILVYTVKLLWCLGPRFNEHLNPTQPVQLYPWVCASNCVLLLSTMSTLFQLMAMSPFIWLLLSLSSIDGNI